MITMNYAVIDPSGLVVNVILWDGVSEWQPPDGHQAVPLTKGGIGWTYVNGQFISPDDV